MTSEPSASQPAAVCRLRPIVTGKSMAETEPGEIVALVDGSSGRFGMVGAHRERGGTLTLVMVYLREPSNGRRATVAWDHYDLDQTVLSFGKAPYFHFDPLSAETMQPHFGTVPTGALVVGREGVLLKAQHAAAADAAAAYFDIASGELVANPSRRRDVSITAWELHLAVDGQPPLVLFRFGSSG